MTIVISEPERRSNPYLDRLKLVEGDITEQAVDAIVTLIPHTLEYRGSINRAILKKADENLDEFILDNLYKPRPGDVYPAPSFGLPCKHIFFCVVPSWKNDFERRDGDLVNAVRRAIDLAREMDLKTLAFPPIGSGANGFPKQRAVRLIIHGIEERLDEGLDEVRIVTTPDMINLFKKRLLTTGWVG